MRIITFLLIVIIPFHGKSTINKSRVPNGIVGKIVTDISNSEFKDASVFLNETTYAGKVNQNGEFKIAEILPGYYQLNVFVPDHKLFTSNILIEENKIYTINIELDRLNTSSKKSKINRFFTNKRLESIYNDFLEKSGYPNDLISDITEHIILSENDNTYKILPNKKLSYVDNGTNYSVNFLFANLNFTDTDHLKPNIKYWFNELNDTDSEHHIQRNNYYTGSKYHLINSILEGKAHENGYFFYDQKGEKVMPVINADVTKKSGYFAINFNNVEHVKFYDIKGFEDLLQSKPQYNTWINDKNQDQEVLVNKYGNILNIKTPFEDVNQNFIQKIPSNFSTFDKRDFYNLFKNLAEAPLISTNKPYYHQGDIIWFNVNMLYPNPQIKDSLSKTVYVCLVNEHKKIISKKAYVIEKGKTAGKLITPNDLEPGHYYLVSYTNWMLNFEKDHTSHPIIILPRGKNILPQKETPEPQNIFEVDSSNKVLAKSENIEIPIALTNPSIIDSLLNISVSIYDADRVSDFRFGSKKWNIKELESNKLKSLDHSIKKGTMVNLRLINDVPETQLAVFNFNTNEVVFPEINSDNTFQLELKENELNKSYLFHFTDKSVTKVPNVEIIEDDSLDLLNLNTEKIEYELAPDEIITYTEIGTNNDFYDNIMLNEVVVEKRKIEDKPDIVRNVSLMAHEKDADQLDLDVLDLVTALRFHIPRLYIFNNTIVFRRFGQYITPGLIVDGNPPLGDVLDNLYSIDPASVVKVEYSNGRHAVATYPGMEGGYIHIITNGSPYKDDLRDNFSSLYINFLHNKESFPVYDPTETENEDLFLGATYLWKADLEITQDGKSELSFYSGDRPALLKVEMIITMKDGQEIKDYELIEVD